MSTPHQLCTLDPAAAVRSAVGPFPPRRSIGDPAAWSAPAGHAYLPIVAADPPAYDPATEKLVGAPDAVIDGQFVTGRYTVEALTTDEISTTTRAAARSALRAQWDELPAFIRGPFRDKFEAANRLLDEGDDEGAIALIDYVAAPDAFTIEQLATFAQVKAAMCAGIEALP